MNDSFMLVFFGLTRENVKQKAGKQPLGFPTSLGIDALLINRNRVFSLSVPRQSGSAGSNADFRQE